jgi:hypothetical protein
MEIMIPDGTAAENHCIVIESSQPVIIPGGVRSAQTRNPAMIGARFRDVQLQICGSRGACERAAQSADRRRALRANWRVRE